jgi:hypothetical protein
MNRALAPELVHETAIAQGVCARPVISKVTDLDTGEVRLVAIWCGSTREDQCPACAERARRLRMQQCREGWHLDTEPEHAALVDQDEGDIEDQAVEDTDRRVRSTRRREDASDLPRMPMEDRTIGRVFTAPDGKTYRPSIFLTLTLPSYGRVTAEGVPVDPESTLKLPVVLSTPRSSRRPCGMRSSSPMANASGGGKPTERIAEPS